MTGARTASRYAGHETLIIDGVNCQPVLQFYQGNLQREGIRYCCAKGDSYDYPVNNKC